METSRTNLPARGLLDGVRIMEVGENDTVASTATTETAKEAFAKAVEWQVAERFTDVTIRDGIKSYTIAEFASVMALAEIANTVDRE